MQNKKSTALVWLFCILLFIVSPLIYSSETEDITLAPQFFYTSIFSLLLIILLFVFGVSRSYTLFIQPITVAIICYFLFSITSIFNSVNWQEGIFDLLKIGLIILLILVFLQLMNSEIRFNEILFKTISISSFILAFIGIIQLTHFGFKNIPGNVIPYGTLGNRNIFIPSVLLLQPLTVYQIFISQNKKWKYFSITSSMLNLTVVLSSGMRTAWLALIISFLFSSFLVLFFREQNIFNFSERAIKKLKVGFYSFVLVGFICGGFYFIHTKKENNVGSVLSTNSTSERVALWKNSFKMLAEHPINGVGVGNWKIMMPNYGLNNLPHEAKIGEMHYQRPENDFVWTFAETGILGGLSYLLIFVFAFYFILKKYKKSKNKNELIFAFIIFNALILYTIAAFWGFPKERNFLSIEFAVIISFVISECQAETSRLKKINIHPVFFILFLVFAIYCSNRMIAGEKTMSKIIEARTNNEHERVLQFANVALEKGYTMDHASTPIEFYKGVANFSMNRIDDALISFEKAKTLHPYHLHILNNLATCYSIKKNHKKTIEYLTEAVRISPDFQNALINLIAELYNTGQTQKALEYLSIASADYKNPTYNQLGKLISKKINDSLLLLSENLINKGELNKADSTLAKCIHKNSIKKYKELIIAINKKRKVERTFK